MSHALRRPNDDDGMSEAERLKALEKQAAAIREQHRRGEITADQAAKKLNDLRRRHISLLDMLFS